MSKLIANVLLSGVAAWLVYHHHNWLAAWFTLLLLLNMGDRILARLGEK